MKVYHQSTPKFLYLPTTLIPIANRQLWPLMVRRKLSKGINFKSELSRLTQNLQRCEEAVIVKLNGIQRNKKKSGHPKSHILFAAKNEALQRFKALQLVGRKRLDAIKILFEVKISFHN